MEKLSNETLEKIRKLISDWGEIDRTITSQRKFPNKLFKETFEGTFSILKDCSTETSVDKERLKLALSVHEFVVKYKWDYVSRRHDFAVELTKKAHRLVCFF